MKVATEQVAAAFVSACLAELEAPKPGNVHRFAPGHGMTVRDFVRSAEASAQPLSAPRARVGARVRGAVEATLAAVGQNTNLGILLLCAPLAAAAEAEQGVLREGLVAVLDNLDREDATGVFAAIVAANPGGLGDSARHDVRAPAKVTLREAMAEAAGRDRIARQYVTGYEDVFAIGLPALAAARKRNGDPSWATLAVYLAYLETAPDTHLARKFGPDAAEAIRREAEPWRKALQAAVDPTALLDGLLQWDASLKERGLNPGASADLTVATLFTERLLTERDDKPRPDVLPSSRNND
jgi:triphosphoribosyl-dephospho-CoA synthase